MLFCALYTDQCPHQGTSLEVSPPYRPSYIAPLPRSVAPSLLRSHPPSPLSLAPSMPTILPHSFPSSTTPPFPHSRSRPTSHHRCVTLPFSLPPHPPLAPSRHPSSLLPCLPPCPPASRRPIICTPYVCLASCNALCSE